MHSFKHIFAGLLIVVKNITASFVALRYFSEQTQRQTAASFRYFPANLNKETDNQDISNEQIDYSDVNPFKGSYNDDKPPVGSILSRKIDLTESMSLRKYKMSKLMENLLRAEDDFKAIKDILSNDKDLLLQQFDDMEAPLEPDTIFLVDGNLVSTREGRFDRYQEAMSARIENSQHRNVKVILAAMMDFVLSHDERQA